MGEFLLFVHIFKAAGTTVQAQIRDALGEEAFPTINWSGDIEVRIARSIADGAQGIVGHASFDVFDRSLRKAGIADPAWITLVREPLARAVSAYNYFRGTPTEPMSIAANEMAPDAFFRHWDAVDPRALRAHQCRKLSARGTKSATDALQNLRERFSFAGTTGDVAALRDVLLRGWGVPIDADRVENRSRKVLRLADLEADTRRLLLDLAGEDVDLFATIECDGPIVQPTGR